MDDEGVDGAGHDAARRARGLAVYREVYGDAAVAFEPGQSDFFDLMMAQLFGEVWGRPGLELSARRLLVMGVLAAQHRFEVLGIQFSRTLETGELSVDQVREVVLQLVAYVGYPSSGDLLRVSETAIAQHLGASR
jgi:4-carboxymuconolactone decarboxylase